MRERGGGGAGSKQVLPEAFLQEWIMEHLLQNTPGSLLKCSF